MKREIRLPDREPIRGWRMALVVTTTNEIIIDRDGLGDAAAAATAIAEGEPRRRVRVEQPHSEVGRRRAQPRLRRTQQSRTAAAPVHRRRSHELRTPLTTIRGWADLYFQGALLQSDATATAMARIAEEAAQLSRLVEELLLLARLDQQRPRTR